MIPPKALPLTGYVSTWNDSPEAFRERMNRYGKVARAYDQIAQSQSVHAPAVGAGVVRRMDDQQSKRKLVGEMYSKALLDEGMTLHKG